MKRFILAVALGLFVAPCVQAEFRPIRNAIKKVRERRKPQSCQPQQYQQVAPRVEMPKLGIPSFTVSRPSTTDDCPSCDALRMRKLLGK